MIGAVLREAHASIRSQPVASAITVLMVVGMILVVMLTTGRTVGAEQDVLDSIDSAGTRSVTIRADPDAGLTADVLDRIDGIEGIEWAAGLSSAVDATNSAVPDGTRVPVRIVYGSHLERLGIPIDSQLPGALVWVSDEAADQLGTPDFVGGVSIVDAGGSFGLGGRLEVPDFLRPFEPLALVPQAADGDERLSVLVVIAETPDLVSPVSKAVVSLLGVDDPSKVTIQTSEALSKLRGLIDAQLRDFSRGLVIALLSLTSLLLAVLLYGLVQMRRKDFGRRRALGASRALIICLLLTQTAVLCLAGTALGIGISLIVLASAGDPLPGASFTGALAVLTVTTALAAALTPAIAASSREPIRELRIP